MKRWGAAWNRHHLEAVVVMLDPNFVEYTPAAPEPVKGRDAYRKVQEPHFKAFPDLELKILSIAASSDLVAAELSFAGTFKGPSNARAMALSAVLLKHNTI